MVVDRASLTTYLSRKYGVLLAEIGLAATDTDDGLGPIIDDVTLVVDAHDSLSEAWHEPLGRYYTLQQAVDTLAVDMDVSISGDSYKLDQQFKHVMVLLENERRTVSWLTGPDAIDPDTFGDLGVVTITSDYLTDEVRPW